MIRRITLALALSLAAPASAQVVVRGEWVTLGDVAPVTGDAARVLVAPAPPPGETLALDPVFLASVAKQSGVMIALPTNSPVLVTRAGAPAAPAAPVARTAPQAGGGRKSSPDGAPRDGWVLVSVGSLSRGDVVSRGDVEWVAPADARNTVRNGPSDLSEVVGMEVKRSLRPDSPIQISDLKQPAVIRKGASVQLVYATPGLRLTAGGIAQQDAGKGESVRVLNQLTKRTVEAIAFAENEARVASR